MQILLLEDDPAIAQTLLFALNKDGFEPFWADSLAKGFEIFYAHDNLSALILDVGLPDGTGFEFCQKVRAGTHLPAVPILFLTARTDEIDRIVGLEMGADDYIAKPFSPRELIARIRAIFRRQELTVKTLQSTSQTGDFDKMVGNQHWRYQAFDYTLFLNGKALVLSKTELGIMLALLANPTHILTREQILTQISEHPEHRLARTIDSHIKTLRQKLSEVCADEIIITHRGLGYSLC